MLYYNLVSMEEDMLTAVTQKDYPVVAPLPSIANRLSVADFQVNIYLLSLAIYLEVAL